MHFTEFATAGVAVLADFSRDAALAAAEEAARIARIGYREGKFGQLDLLDAERTLAQTRAAAIDALLDRGAGDDVVPLHRLLPTELVLRGTTATKGTSSIRATCASLTAVEPDDAMRARVGHGYSANSILPSLRSSMYEIVAKAWIGAL